MHAYIYIHIYMYICTNRFATKHIQSRHSRFASQRVGSVLRYDAVCCSMLQCAAVWCSVLRYVAVCCSTMQCVTIGCSVLQYVTVCCCMLHCVAIRYSVLWYVVVCVLQHVAVWCSNVGCQTLAAKY